MFDGAKLSSLMKLNSSYTDSSPSVIRMGYRGLPALISTGTVSYTHLDVYKRQGISCVPLFAFADKHARQDPARLQYLAVELAGAMQ